MRAAVFYGPRDIRIEDVPKPKIEAGEVLIKVKACSICGSDLHNYKLGMFPDLGIPINSGGRIMGHEFAGDVVELGEKVEGISIGDRVTAIGYGAMAEYVKVRAIVNQTVFHLPSRVSYEEAATAEPLATSLHAVNTIRPVEGDTILIVGAGTIGLGILQVLKARSSNRVVVADISQKRLDMAKQLGADFVVDPAKGDIAQQLNSMVGTVTGKIGIPSCAIDIGIDCAGVSAEATGMPVIEQLIHPLVREGGKVGLVASYENKVTLDFNFVMGKELRILGSLAYSPEEIADSVELIRDQRVDRKVLISHEFPLSKAKEAFETQLAVRESLKVLIKP